MSMPHGCIGNPCVICHPTAAPMTTLLLAPACPICGRPNILRSAIGSTDDARCECISVRLTCGPGKKGRTHLDFGHTVTVR